MTYEEVLCERLGHCQHARTLVQHGIRHPTSDETSRWLDRLQRLGNVLSYFHHYS